MAVDKFHVTTEGNIRGAWLTVPEGLLNVVAEQPGRGVPYVGVHVGEPTADVLPYAMSFSPDNGELMLQIPDPDHPKSPTIVSMEYVRRLVKAALGGSH